MRATQAGSRHVLRHTVNLRAWTGRRLPAASFYREAGAFEVSLILLMQMIL